MNQHMILISWTFLLSLWVISLIYNLDARIISRWKSKRIIISTNQIDHSLSPLTYSYFLHRSIFEEKFVHKSSKYVKHTCPALKIQPWWVENKKVDKTLWDEEKFVRTLQNINNICQAMRINPTQKPIKLLYVRMHSHS